MVKLDAVEKYEQKLLNSSDLSAEDIIRKLSELHDLAPRNDGVTEFAKQCAALAGDDVEFDEVTRLSSSLVKEKVIGSKQALDLVYEHLVTKKNGV